MDSKKSALGRGLSALIESSRAAYVDGRTAAVAGSEPTIVARGDTLTRLPVGLLQRGRYQPRVDMREDSLSALADSIRAQGVIQPIVVRPLFNGTQPDASQRYEIIAGERRWRAARLAGLDTIPAIIRHVPDEAAVAMSLIENIQRENLNPLEEAHALTRLIQEFQLTHQQAANAVGRSRAAVTNLLRLLDVADPVKALIESRQLEMGHARALLGVSDPHRQSALAALVAKRALSVRDTEALVRRAGGSTARRSDGATSLDDPELRSLLEAARASLGAHVVVKTRPTGGGQVLVSFDSTDELKRYLATLRRP